MFKILIYYSLFWQSTKASKRCSSSRHQDEVVRVLTNTLETANVSVRASEILTINYSSFLSYMLVIHFFYQCFSFV